MAATQTAGTPPSHTPIAPAFDVTVVLRRFAANNWKVALYVVMIIMCVLFTPEEPSKFIYTEF